MQLSRRNGVGLRIVFPRPSVKNVSLSTLWLGSGCGDFFPFIGAGKLRLVSFMSDDFPNNWQDEVEVEDGVWYHVTASHRELTTRNRAAIVVFPGYLPACDQGRRVEAAGAGLLQTRDNADI